MPLDSRDAARVRDMIDYAQRAMEMLGDRSCEDMVENLMLRLALVRCIEIIGEAATHVDPRVREQHDELPWALMSGMRNRLIHDYGNTNFTIVHDVVRVELPRLVTCLQSLLDEG